MSKIISLTNQKGGVGKTTSSVNLAVSFAVSEVKTLLIDLDPQSNATTGIEELIDEQVDPGKHEIRFEAFEQSTGIYFIQLLAGEQRLVKKLILLK